ncbi:AAA family ATPase [Streptomyces parvus]|uniref:Helix-turn-helix transcriptional regulator n=1 Tax=Streptomyces parvus TaxID=66428 RepID=A0A5D4JKM6_9ACTN|nr:LuxR family transcriptional regulator [Streptomyces parvus]TYR65376.1 helix-turn-helix transcriptional regulator [Streptomyces parvus]
MSRSDDARLLGREREQELLADALDGVVAGKRGAAIVLRGEAGIGKTALLSWVKSEARRRGLGVLGAAGAVGESELAFGVFHQVFWPLVRHSSVASPQRGALECALGLREGPKPDGAALGASAWSVLAEAARERPLLLALDDLHWADESSAAVFAFLHRRVSALPALVIGATREDGRGLTWWMEDEIRLGALELAAAEALLRRRSPAMTAAMAGSVLAEAAGNPLALLELPMADGGEPGGGLAAPAQTSPAHRLENLFDDRIRALSEEAAHVLLLAALAGQEQDTTAWTTALPGTRGDEVLSDIEASELAYVDASGALLFRHPLVRSAVLSLSSPERQRAARRILADGLEADDPRRLVHESMAAILPDASLAARLEDAGRRIAARGGDAEGAVLMDRAAALSTDPAAHTRRLIWAAVMAARGGRLSHTAALVEELKRRPVPEGCGPLFAYAVVYVDQSHQVDFASSFTLLPDALDVLMESEVEPFEGLTEQLYFKLLLASVYTDDSRGWRALAKHANGMSPLARLSRDAWSDPARTAHGVARVLGGVAAAISGRREASAAWFLLWTASAVDAADEALCLRFSGEHGYATQGSIAKARLYQDFLRGRWERADLCLHEAETAERLGYHCNALLFRHYHAHFLAGRGDERGLREVEARIGPVAEAAGMRFVTDHLLHLRGLVALAHGRYEEAYLLCERLMPPGVLPRGLPWFHLPFFDLVVAAMHTGRRAEAAAHVRAARAARMAEISGHHAFLLAAAAAVAAPDEEADACYHAAYQVPGASTWAFSLARLRLEHGSWLRRRRRAESRVVLNLAHEEFRRLGAGPWVERCEEELTAEGSAGGEGPLTGQERRIAQLVAKGMTNKEVGRALRLSPRTVAAHLYKIFPKLGVTSRAGIAQALAGEPDGLPGRAPAVPVAEVTGPRP